MQTDIQKNMPAYSGQYALATGGNAVRRLHVLHSICSPVGLRVLRKAGLRKEMRVADFGCGVGATTKTLAEEVGPLGSVTAVDVSAAQLAEAKRFCDGHGLHNVTYHQASACETELASDQFDLVYCRFLLLHLPDPIACLREMLRVLKPGGILVAEDGDLRSATSRPPTALSVFGDLFWKFGLSQGLDYSLSKDLLAISQIAGCRDAELEEYQPELVDADSRLLLKWSVEEAGPAFVAAGITTQSELERTLVEMQAAADDRAIAIFGPRMSLLTARKAGV